MCERTPQAVEIGARAKERRRMDAEVDGAGPSAMVVEKDVVEPSAMVVESDSARAFTHGYRGWALRANVDGRMDS